MVFVGIDLVADVSFHLSTLRSSFKIRSFSRRLSHRGLHVGHDTCSEQSHGDVATLRRRAVVPDGACALPDPTPLELSNCRFLAPCGTFHVVIVLFRIELYWERHGRSSNVFMDW